MIDNYYDCDPPVEKLLKILDRKIAAKDKRIAELEQRLVVRESIINDLNKTTARLERDLAEFTKLAEVRLSTINELMKNVKVSSDNTSPFIDNSNLFICGQCLLKTDHLYEGLCNNCQKGRMAVNTLSCEI